MSHLFLSQQILPCLKSHHRKMIPCIPIITKSREFSPEDIRP